MLNAIALSVKRHNKVILNKIDICIKTGQLISLLGSNGAGKSTLLASLAAEIKLQRKNYLELSLDGLDISDLPAHKLAKKRMVLPQKPGLAFDLSVQEVVAMGAYPFKQIKQAQLKSLIDQSLDIAEIRYLTKRRYLELSGGEQQRVQFARVVLQALAAKSISIDNCYILLDEPTASLDPKHQQSLLKALAKLASAESMGILVILHDINLAARWSDAIALLANGKILACGKPQDVINTENIKAVYGVDAAVLKHPIHPSKILVVFN